MLSVKSASQHSKKVSEKVESVKDASARSEKQASEHLDK